MKQFLTASFIFLCLCTTLFAERFTIGEKNIEVPAPAGFVRVTPEMSTVYRFAEKTANYDPKYIQLGYYIAQEDVADALEGKLPPRKRTFFARVNKSFISDVVGTQEFDKLMENTKTENHQIIADARAQNPELYDEMIKGVEKQQASQDFEFKVSQFLPLKEHDKTLHSMSFSMLYTMRVSDGNASQEDVVSCTMTHLNPAGKMLFLFCYAPQEELKWSRDASKLWTDAILASNPLPPEGNIQRGSPIENTSPSGNTKIIIISVGLVVMGLLYLFRRNRNQTT